MKRWIKSELHNHSTHSDGRQSPRGLVETFAARGVGLLALTDHNSVTGHGEFLAACREFAVIPLCSNEISTFWGHVLGLGLEEYIDWRGYCPTNGEDICRDIRAKGALTGLAHPFRLGYPINPGCNWMFEIEDYSNFDYIEVMNTSDKGRCLNHVAVDFWIELCQKGIKTTALAGKDWHGRPNDESIFSSFILLDEADPKPLEAIKAGQAYLSACGFVDAVFSNKKGEKAWAGDSLAKENGLFDLEITFFEELAPAGKITVLLSDQRGEAFCKTVQGEGVLQLADLNLEGFAILRLFHGEGRDFENLLALFNPVYL